MKEYKIAKGWVLFFYLITPVIIVAFGWGMTLPFQNGDFEPSLDWLIIPVCLAVICFTVLALLDAHKCRLILYPDKIILKTTFSNRQLAFEEIKGYIQYTEFIRVSPIDKSKKAIKINKYFEGYLGILNWLEQNFVNLEKARNQEEQEEILQDETLGWTREQREESLKSAKRTVKFLNWAGGICAVWLFFFPYPYAFAMLSGMGIPLVVLLLVKFYRGLIRVDEKPGTAYPSILAALMFPSLTLMCRALIDYEMYDYAKLWLYVSGVCFVLLFFFLVGQEEIRLKKRSSYITVLALTMLLLAYSFGATIFTNCHFDDSKPEVFLAQVLDKRISDSDITVYYLKLSPWGEQTESEEVSVDEDFYNSIDVGNHVNVLFRQGALDIPWFHLSDE